MFEFDTSLAFLPGVIRNDVKHRLKTFTEALSNSSEAKSGLMRNAQVSESVIPVFASSEFVSNVCKRHPELIIELVQGGDLSRQYEAGEITAKLQAQTVEQHSEEKLGGILRQNRRREAVRIAWRDLAGWADLDEVMAILSELADASIQQALRFAHSATQEKHGVPIGRDSGNPIELSVFGLGKLGGSELNFSSDVDLIFAYAEEGEIDGRRSISNHEFFLRCGRLLIKLLDDITPDGQVFRVDMRLRPNGDSGPLALSFDAMEHYYQTHGRDWERYALIKARSVAGDVEQGERLLDTLRPFVYRKYLDFGAFDAIRDMKTLIEKQLTQKGLKDNVKLGLGGIREIEFIAQSYQLIHGGRKHELQTNKLATAYEGLVTRGILTRDETDELNSDYCQLRSIEHRLQMVRDQQTHVLPEDDTARAQLAFACNYGSWDTFYESFSKIRRRVHEKFLETFVSGETGNGQHVEFFSDLWSQALDEDQAVTKLSASGFEEPELVIKELRAQRTGHNYQSFSKSGRERLDKLMPLLLQEVAATKSPDRTLLRVLNVVQTIGRRSAYLALLVENHIALKQLVELCAASQWISNWIGGHPVILDELLTPLSQGRLADTKAQRRELRRRLTQIDARDLESQMNTMREFAHANVLCIAAADIAGTLDAGEIGERLSALAQTILIEVTDVAIEGLAPRFGRPMIERNGEHINAAFSIVAYGKLGSEELGYNSDLDIIFLYQSGRLGAQQGGGETQGGEKTVSNEYYFSRLAQRIVHILTTRTPAGLLYQADMRLRPSGNSGTVVTSIEAYANYQKSEAWTWEHQAIVRARMVTGDSALCEQFDQIRSDILYTTRDQQQLIANVKKMRERMIAANSKSDESNYDLKLDRGGMVDIEFIAQYLVLLGARKHTEMQTVRKTRDILEAASKNGLLGRSDAEQLMSVYETYLKFEQGQKIKQAPSLIAQTEMLNERETVRKIWREIFSIDE